MLVVASQSVGLFKSAVHVYFHVLIVSACEFWKEAVCHPGKVREILQ